MSIFKGVYRVVKKIPQGWVATYGLTGKMAGVSPRIVGWALHVNRDSEVPCHRVVNREGKLAASFGMGGWQEQKRRLQAEGVKFKDEKHVDLKKCLSPRKTSSYEAEVGRLKVLGGTDTL